MNKSQIDIEDLFDWLEQQPELAQLRKQAAATPCEYCPTEITTDLRLKTKANTELANEEGIIGKFRDIIWVPGRNMRGNAFSTPELDRSLSSVAKLMSISTLWDFVTTIPLFSFSLSIFLGELYQQVQHYHLFFYGRLTLLVRMQLIAGQNIPLRLIGVLRLLYY